MQCTYSQGEPVAQGSGSIVSQYTRVARERIFELNIRVFSAKYAYLAYAYVSRKYAIYAYF